MWAGDLIPARWRSSNTQDPALRVLVETGQHVGDRLVRGGPGDLRQRASRLPQRGLAALPAGTWLISPWPRRSWLAPASANDSSRLRHTGGIIRPGTPAGLAATSVYRRASLSNVGDRDNLLAHPDYLILGPEGLGEGRTHVAEEDGSLAGFATWAETAGTLELEDLLWIPLM